MCPTDAATDGGLFTTIRREATLAHRVARQLEALIAERHLQPGDRLPAERELARQLGVSRTVVREAVTSLAARSLLEPQQGGGALVRRPDADSVARSMSLYLTLGTPPLDYAQIHDVRRLLEIEIARRAADHRTEADLECMETLLQEADHGITDRDLFARNDVAFHAALARASGNPLYGVLMDALAAVMLEVRRRGFETPGTPERALTHHRSLFERVRDGDGEGARRAMEAHLREAEETQRRVLALSRPENDQPGTGKE